MTRRTVGVDVTAHKEERNVTDTRKKTKLRVRYYVELLVGSPRASHTRLGFSSSFQALLRLHRAFEKLYADKYGDPHGGLLTGRESFLSSSSSTSLSSVSSTSKASPTSISRFMRHTLGLKKKATREQAAQSRASESNQAAQQYVQTPEGPGIVPFPVENKLLVHFESDEAKDDAKIELRNNALFEYYSRLFNSDDGEMYLELVHHRSLEAADKKKAELSDNQSENGGKHPASFSSSSSNESGGIFKLLRPRGQPEDVSSKKHVEFLEPVHVRGPSKSRGHRSSHRRSSQLVP